MTLDVYAGLFADDLDDGADRLNALEPRCAPSWRDPYCCTPLPYGEQKRLLPRRGEASDLPVCWSG